MRKAYRKSLKKEYVLTPAQEAGLEKGKALARSGKLKPPPPSELTKKQKKALREHRKLQSRLRRSDAAVSRIKIKKNIERSERSGKKKPKDYSKVKVEDVPYEEMGSANQCHMNNKKTSYFSRNITDKF